MSLLPVFLSIQAENNFSTSSVVYGRYFVRPTITPVVTSAFLIFFPLCFDGTMRTVAIPPREEDGSEDTKSFSS